MEAKCKKCSEFFKKHEIVVTQEGIYCEGCVPDNPMLLGFTFIFSWKGINALMDFIDGSVDLEVLEIIDKVRKGIDKRILEQLRFLLRNEDVEIREPDPKSLGEGDAEY